MLKLDGLLRLLYTDSTKHDRSGGPVMINRDEYLNQLIAFRDKQLIKVVSGIRRCGKSTLFELYKDYLLDCDVDDSLTSALQPSSACIKRGLCLRKYRTNERHVWRCLFRRSSDADFLTYLQ